MKRRATPAPEQPTDPFNRAPPGWSLTQPKGKWPWESPPQHTKPDEVVDMILDKLEDRKTLERYLKLMVAGVSVEEIVSSISLAGFTEGKFNPDVAEIIKPPLAVFLIARAEENGIPVRVFAAQEKDEEDEAGLPTSTILRIMRKRNPDLYNYISTRDVKQAKGTMMQESRAQGTLLRAEMPVETGDTGFIDPEPMPEQPDEIQEPLEDEEQ